MIICRKCGHKLLQCIIGSYTNEYFIINSSKKFFLREIPFRDKWNPQLIKLKYGFLGTYKKISTYKNKLVNKCEYCHTHYLVKPSFLINKKEENFSKKLKIIKIR